MNVINFNRNQLPQREKFVNRLGGYNSSKKTEFNLPKATSKQLKEIAKRLKEEHKIRMIKVFTLTIIIFLGLVFAILY